MNIGKHTVIFCIDWIYDGDLNNDWLMMCSELWTQDVGYLVEKYHHEKSI